MTFSKVVVADVNGDGYDDLVAIGTDIIDDKDPTHPVTGLVIDVYLNEGKTRGPSEAVNFSLQQVVLTTHSNAAAVADKVRFSAGYDVDVTDLDGDGYPDILASSAATGEIFVLWNQGPAASKLFDPSNPSASLTVVSPLAQHSTLGSPNNVLGTPIYVAAVNLGIASRYKSIVAYHGALQLDPSSPLPAPFNQHNYEALAIFYPMDWGFPSANFYNQRDTWLSFDGKAVCDLSFGIKFLCPKWKDGMGIPSEADELSNFRVSYENGRGNLTFAEAPSDIVQMDQMVNVGTPQQAYQPGVYRPNASPGLQILKGHGPGGSDSVWLQGGGEAYEFVADKDLVLMRRQTDIGTVLGNERSAGSTFGTLSTGATALITAGGMRVVYDLSDPTTAVDQSVPDYLNRVGQVGAWLGWAPLDSGPALLSLSDYYRNPDPAATQFRWPHLPLDGSTPPRYTWGGSRTLVMLDFAQETTVASGTQFKPFFQAPDEAHFQAFTILGGGAVNHKPFIAPCHCASPHELALVMLDHADGVSTDPAYTHLDLYRPDTAKTYASPTPHLDGLTVGRFIEDGLADIGITLPQGEVSGVLVGAHLGTDTPDGIRYVTVHDKTTGTIKGIFPANPAETIKEISKDGVVVPGLSTLAVGNYTLEVHNATAMASMNLNVVNPYGITTTDFDWRANNACGLLPNTKDANLWPEQIAVAVTNFPDAVQAVRWINQDDGTVVNLGSEGATYDAATSTVTLIVPQGGQLKDGNWRVAIQAGGMWQPLRRTWKVARDTATLASCAQQVSLVNEEAYSQCTDHDLYLAPAQYKVWPHLVNLTFRFFGSNFELNHVKEAAIKQGNHRYFSSSFQLIDNSEVHVEFGDLSTQLTADVETEFYFYSETGDVVDAKGVSAVGGIPHWRTARSGDCLQTPPVFTSITGGSGEGGAYQGGDVVTAKGTGLIYPVPTGVRLFLTDKDSGAQYALPAYLPDDFDKTHYDNSNGKLLFAIPNADEWDQYLVTPPEHLTGDYSAKSLKHPNALAAQAFSAQAAFTTASEFTLSKVAVPAVMGWAFCQGVALAGNTCDGVAGYAFNYLKNSVSPNPNPSPGIPRDDQPPNPEMLWITEYIANNGYEQDPNLYVAVFKANASNWIQELRNAIWNQGRGAYPFLQNISPWPCDKSDETFNTYACIVYAKPVGSVFSTNPDGIPFIYVSSTWFLYNLTYDSWTGLVESANTGTYSDSPGPTDSWMPVPSMNDQFLWRFSALPGFEWRPGLSRQTRMVTGPANDCSNPYTMLTRCYQIGISPYP